MKGWEFTGTHQPLKIVEKPDPKAKPGYVVLKTLAGGLCHSDVSALDIESWMGSFNVPVIMGHEICGRIVEIGEGVEGYEVGDVVDTVVEGEFRCLLAGVETGFGTLAYDVVDRRKSYVAFHEILRLDAGAELRVPHQLSRADSERTCHPVHDMI